MQPHVRQAAMRHLARLLESGSTTKVRAWELLCTALCPTAMHALQRPAGPRHLPHTSNSHHCAICPHPTFLLQVLRRHDCRGDCEALFYLYGIRCAGVWDTQASRGVAAWGCADPAVRLPIQPASPQGACSSSLELQHAPNPFLLPSPHPTCAGGLWAAAVPVQRGRRQRCRSRRRQCPHRSQLPPVPVPAASQPSQGGDACPHGAGASTV
jgi:hypothetical protein